MVNKTPVAELLLYSSNTEVFHLLMPPLLVMAVVSDTVGVDVTSDELVESLAVPISPLVTLSSKFNTASVMIYTIMR